MQKQLVPVCGRRASRGLADAFLVLKQIFRHTRYGQAPARGTLCRRLRLSDEQLDAALQELEQRELLDAERLRLTLSGLAVAVALGRPHATSARTLPCPASSAASLWRSPALPYSWSGSWAGAT